MEPSPERRHNMDKDSLDNVKLYRERTFAERSLANRFFDCLKAIPLLRGISASRRACWFSRDREPQEGAPVFVAVHGTWNKRAAWARPDSNLFKKLSELCPQSGLCRFVWSATNGIRHRLVAADVLSEVLKDLEKTYPSSPIVAIAHSHGGNVLAWASTRIKTPLAAAVYLNTPFIQALPSTEPSKVPFLRIVLALVGAIVFVPLAIRVQYLFPRRPDLDIKVFFAAVAIIVLGIVSIQAIVPRWIKSIRNRLIDSANGARSVSRELAAFVVGDEPNSAFGAVYFLQWFGRRSAITLLLVAWLSALLSHKGPNMNATTDRLLPYLFLAIAAIYTAYLVLAVSAYGLVQGLLALDATVSATPAPLGHTDSLTITWSNDDWVRHFLVHDSPHAIKPIVEWLKDVLGSSVDSPRPRDERAASETL